MCLLLLSRPFYDNHSYIHTRKYVCLCAVNHPARYCCCAAPTTAVASVDRQQTSFCVCILECRLIVVVVAAVLLGCLLYFIFFFRFRICHHHHHRTQSIHTHICICGCSCIHTYIPELTGNRQRLYFIISFATLGLSRVSCCLRKGRGSSRIEYAYRKGNSLQQQQEEQEQQQPHKLLFRTLSLARSFAQWPRLIKLI